MPISAVVGRAILITWPIERWGWLDNYRTTFSRVEDTADTPGGPVSANPNP